MADELARIIQVVCQVGGLRSITSDQDIYEAGVSSLQALGLLLEIESVFAVAIPDREFVLARTPRALLELVAAQRAP